MLKPKFSNGNSKTGVGVFIFNLPAQSTCIGSTPMCRSKCYAMKAQRKYPATRDQRDHNMACALSNEFVDDVVELLNLNKFQTFVRIHESGDFYSQEYLDKWIQIARKCKTKRFLAFTKSTNLDFSKLPENLVIYVSKFPDSPDVPRELSKRPIAYAGTCTTRKNVLACSGTCSSCVECWNGKKDIHFNLH
jgi:hypothetical protein